MASAFTTTDFGERQPFDTIWYALLTSDSLFFPFNSHDSFPLESLGNPFLRITDYSWLEITNSFVTQFGATMNSTKRAF